MKTILISEFKAKCIGILKAVREFKYMTITTIQVRVPLHATVAALFLFMAPLDAQQSASNSINFTLGGIFPVTGVMADGGATTEAFLMAVDAVNADSHYTFQIRALTADSQTDAGAAAQAAQTMIDDGANAIIGGVTSVVSDSIAVEAAGPALVPQISPTASAARFSDKSTYPYFLRLLRGDTEARVLADIVLRIEESAALLNSGLDAETVNANRVAMLSGGDAYSSDVSDQTAALLAGNGVEVERFIVDDGSGISIGADIDIVYLIALNSAAVEAIQRVGDNDYHWLLSASIANQDFVDAVSEVQRGAMIAVEPVGGRGVLYDRFLESWCAGTDPSAGCPEPVFWTPLTYDAVKVYAEAVQGLLDAGTPPEDIRGEVLLEALANARVAGLTGSIRFDENLDRASVPYKLAVAIEEQSPLADAAYWNEDGFSREEFAFAGMIKIGAAVSMSGRYAVEGADVRQGYDTWLDWVNHEKGGVQIGTERYGFEMIYYDDQSEAANAATLVEQLIVEDGVQFLLGPYSSGITAAASEVSEQYGVIMIEGNGADEGLFERGYENLFAVLTPAGNYTQSALQALADKGARTVVIAYEDEPFPRSVAEGAKRWAAEYGMQVLAEEVYPPSVEDVSGILESFKPLAPDVFVGGGHFLDALLLTQTAKALDFNPKAMVITVGPSNPEFIEQLGTDADYILGPTQWEPVMAYEDPWFGTARDYAERYESLWNESPTYQAAQSTAAGLALTLALEDAGSLETAAVREALNRLDATTFYGPIQFDESGKNVGKPMGSIQIQNGAIKVVAPAESAESDLLYPTPAWDERETTSPLIDDWSIGGGRFGFRWSGQSGAGYAVEFSPSLTEPDWTQISSIPAEPNNAGQFSFEDSAPVEGKTSGFYRVRQIEE